MAYRILTCALAMSDGFNGLKKNSFGAHIRIFVPEESLLPNGAFSMRLLTQWASSRFRLVEKQPDALLICGGSSAE